MPASSKRFCNKQYPKQDLFGNPCLMQYVFPFDVSRLYSGQSFFTEKAPKCNNEKQVLSDRFCSASFKGSKCCSLFPLNLNAILISDSGGVLGHRWQSDRRSPACRNGRGQAGSSEAQPAAVFAAP